MYLQGCQLAVMLHAEGSLLAPTCRIIWIPEAADFGLTVLHDALSMSLAICVDPVLLHAWGRLTLRRAVPKLMRSGLCWPTFRGQCRACACAASECVVLVHGKPPARYSFADLWAGSRSMSVQQW